MYHAKIKEDHFFKSDRDEERLVWMMRLAEGLGESRFGLECYNQLFTYTTNVLKNMIEYMDKLDESIEASFYCAHLSAKIFVHIMLISKLIDDNRYSDLIIEEMGGELNPLKGLIARSFAFQHLPNLFASPEKALENTIKCCSLWVRWVRYGSCSDIEVREWEEEQLYSFVEQALCQLLSICRRDLDKLFPELIINKLLQEYLVATANEKIQTKVLMSILDNIPKSITSRFLESMILNVVRFSPAVNIIGLLQRLIEDAFTEGSVQTCEIWERVKEIINMRPELDLNDALQLCSTIIKSALKESSPTLTVEVLKFTTETLLEDIQLSLSESASYALSCILENLAYSLKTQQDILTIIPWMVTVSKKLDRKCIQGLGIKALRSVGEISLSDWTAMCALVTYTEDPNDDLIQEIFRQNIDVILPFFKPYINHTISIVENIIKRNVSTVSAQVIKDVLEPPRLEFFSLYINLFPKYEGRDRYDLLVNVLLEIVIDRQQWH